jgi:GNAT superfamily N-acetyltransferase
MVDVGVLDHLDSAVETAVGDPHLGRPQPMSASAILDLEPEGVEADQAPDCPDQIAEPAEPALEPVRNALADHRRQAHRRAIGEIVAVDHSEVDPPPPAGGDGPDRAFEVERDAERSGEAVGGAERQQSEDAVASDDEIDRAGERAVAAADDHHRRAVGHRLVDLLLELARVAHGMRLYEPDAGLLEPPLRLLELRPPAARMGVDDEHGFAGDWTSGTHQP